MGGSSSKKVLSSCFSTVWLKQPDTAMTPSTPRTIQSDTISAAPALGKNRLPRRIRVGNQPLQGTMAFVRIAMSLSRGESMILHPITPTALQPNPIQRVSACFPQPPHRHIP